MHQQGAPSRNATMTAVPAKQTMRTSRKLDRNSFLDRQQIPLI